MATSVEALGDLFGKHADVDRQVHLRVVVATINELDLDTAAALRVSQLIEQQPCFSAEEKQELQKAVEERVQSITKEPGKIRRSQQNYSQLYLWLTEPTWEAIMSGIFTKQTEALFLHLHLLGLRLPSENTFATMTGTIAIFQPGGQEKTGFQLHTMLETVKSSWKSFQNKRKKELNNSSSVHLLVLPSTMAELPEELRSAAFSIHPRVEQPKTNGNDLETLIAKIPRRKSNLAVAGQGGSPQSSSAGTENAKDALMLQMMQWFTRQMVHPNVSAVGQVPNITYLPRNVSNESLGQSSQSPTTSPAACGVQRLAVADFAAGQVASVSQQAMGQSNQASSSAAIPKADPGLLCLEDSTEPRSNEQNSVQATGVDAKDIGNRQGGMDSKPIDKSPMEVANSLMDKMEGKKKQEIPRSAKDLPCNV